MLVKSGDTSQYGRCAIELFRMLIFVVSDEHLSLIIVRRDSLACHSLFSEYLQRQKNNERNGISKLGGNQNVAA